MGLKSGWKTTEFWVSIITSMVGILVTLGLFTPDNASSLIQSISMIVGGIVTSVPIVGYAISRGKAKSN